MLGGIEHVERLDIVLSFHLEMVLEVRVEDLGDLVLVVLGEREVLHLLLELQCADQPDVVMALKRIVKHNRHYLARDSAIPGTWSSPRMTDLSCTTRQHLFDISSLGST